VVSVSPATGAQNVPTNSPVVIQFSEPIAATSVTDQTVVLSVLGVAAPTTMTLQQNNTAAARGRHRSSKVANRRRGAAVGVYPPRYVAVCVLKKMCSVRCGLCTRSMTVRQHNAISV
jgi:hypothetical protein